MDADRNLLFGILALQMELIQRDDLIRGMNAWVLEKAKPLAQILEEQGKLDPADRRMLEPLVARHVQVHNNNPQKSLAALSSVSSLQRELKQIADPELQASLAPLGEGFGTLPAPPRPAVAHRFRILRPHAKGGLGEVFVANDEELNREVALKEIQSLHAFQPEFRSRFMLEAEITGGLEHPGIVPVYGLGSYADGRPFYAMRFIRGDSMQDAIRRFHEREKPGRDPHERSLALRELLGRFVDVCQAIAYAHSRGVLHRDLKPGNVMLGRYGETLIVDWGLAKASGKPAGDHPSVWTLTQQGNSNGARAEKVRSTEGTVASATFVERLLVPRSSTGGEAITQMGQAVGTPAYMSPEQAAGRLDQLGPASDVYSLGATLYTLLTGVPSLVSSDLGELLRRVEQGEIAPPRSVAANVPAAVDAVCRKAMAWKPLDRYSSAQDLAAEIERWLADEPVQAYREPWSVRAQRWLGRHRTAATAAAVGLAIACAGLAVVLALTKAGAEREKTLRIEEQIAKDDAIAFGQLALTREQEARRYLYTAHMNLAQQAWEIANIGRVREILDLYRNPPTTVEDPRGWEWYYQDRLCQSDLLTLEGHTKLVTCVAFNPDGATIASASGDHTIKLWDTVSGQELRTFNGHAKGVTCLAYSPNGATIASASWDNLVKIWDATSGQELHTFKGHTDKVMGVAFSPDGAKIASASGDGEVKLWDTLSATELLTIKAGTPYVYGVAFSPDGARVAASSIDDSVKLWDAATGKELLKLTGHSSTVSSVAFSPDASKIVTASWDHTVKLWDTASGQTLRTLQGHSDLVESAKFSPDGATIASASRDHVVKLWDSATGQELRTIMGHYEPVYCVAFSPDGTRLATASADNTVKLWDAICDREKRTFESPHNNVTAVAFSPDGAQLASAGHDAMKLWDIAAGQMLRAFPGHTSLVNSVAFSPDGARLASASYDNTIKLWDASSGREVHSLAGHSASVSCAVFSPDGARLASGSWDHSVKLWNASSGKELHTLTGHSSSVTSVAFSPDGARLASASYDKTVKLWDTATGAELRTLAGHGEFVSSVAFSPDGARLASASGDYTVKTWDPATGQELRTLRGHSHDVNSVVFSPDGARLVSGSRDRTVKLWDAASGQELRTLKGHSADVTSVAFSPDGGIIASACGDHTVRLWDAKPLTSALRVELEAHALVVYYFELLKRGPHAEGETHSLFGFALPQPSPKAQLLARLRYAPGRSELVRKKALELAEEYWSLRNRLKAMAGVEPTLEQNLVRRPKK